jgi:fucose permease
MFIANGADFHRKALLAAAYSCMFLFGFVLLLMGSMLPSLQVSYVQSGNLGSVPLAGILAATVLVGPLLDKLGGKIFLSFGLALIAVSLGAIPWLHHYAALIAAAFVYGIGGGLLNTAANAVVAGLAESSRATALNLLGLFFSLGAIAAPLLMSSLGGMSPSTVLPVLAALAIAILIPTLLLDFPYSVDSQPGLAPLFSVLAHPAVWLFGGLLFFESGSENCMFVWSSKIVALLTGASAQQANLALVGLSAAFGIGRLLAVLWIRWLGNRGTIWLSCAMATLGALFASANQTFLSATAGIIVVGLGLSAIFPTVLGLAADRFPKETGTVFGAIIGMALVGGTTGPSLAARLAEVGPARVFWIPITAAAAVATFTAILTRSTGNPAPASRTAASSITRKL